MGNNKDTLTAQNITRYLIEVSAVLQRLQPELKAQILDGVICVSGTLICSGDKGAFDAFEIAALLPLGFPIGEPLVWETGERIPREADRHIYPTSGNCCLCVWQEWLWNTPNPDFEAFLTGPLHSYFVSQSVFELTGQWPFGERGHDKEGLDQALEIMLNAIPKVRIDSALALLSQTKIKGHARCPCGSGKRLRNCHLVQLLALQERMTSISWKKMRLRRNAFS